jgi:hypothetical protein
VSLGVLAWKRLKGMPDHPTMQPIADEAHQKEAGQPAAALRAATVARPLHAEQARVARVGHIDRRGEGA